MTDANSIRTLAPFTQHSCFTLWRLDPPRKPGGKPLKTPIHHDGSRNHSLAFPAPPLTAGQAFEWITYLRTTGVGHDRVGEIGYVGMGFRPSGTGLVCLDVDACIAEDGTWAPIALEMMARFPGALVETSISGRGLHIWFTSRKPIPNRSKDRSNQLEMYGDGQFIATGTVICGDAVTDCTEAAETLLAERWAPLSVAGSAEAVDFEALEVPEKLRIVAEIESAARYIDQSSYGGWIELGNPIKSLGDEYGLPLWHKVSSWYAGYDEYETARKWLDLACDRTDYRAIFAKAAANGWLNPRARAEVELGQFGSDPLPEGATSERAVTSAAVGGSFVAAAGGAIPATLANVHDALASSEGETQLRYDEFTDAVMIGARPLEDEDYGHLRAAFERRGFKAVAAEVMRTAVSMVARARRFDSAREWLGGLQWDGVERVAGAMTRYYGCAPGAYPEAVSRYLFTAMAGRCMQAGVKADMAVILVGLQGARKTSAVQALVPNPQFFGEVDLGKSDDALARSMRGKLVMELAELKGLSGRDSESTKAWISRQWEEWVPKYKELGTRYGRRCVLIGTDNKGEFLDDETGARRYLPVTVTRADVDALERDRDQLWAEGVAMWRAGGIAWADAERLAQAEHSKYEVVDELLPVVATWLATPPEAPLGQPKSVTPRGVLPVRSADILYGALGMAFSQIKRADQLAIAKIMRKLNYVRSTQRVNGVLCKVWVQSGNVVR